MSINRSTDIRVEIVVAEGTYHVHLPTRKAGDTVKYNPRSGELLAVCVNPAADKLVGVPLRPFAEPLFARHFARMILRYNHLPWVVSVSGSDIEQQARVLLAKMFIQAHREWSCALKSAPNMLNEPIACGFIELKRWELGVTFRVDLSATPVSATPPHSELETVTSSMHGNISRTDSHSHQKSVQESYSAWANNLFRSKYSNSIACSIESADSLELDRTPGSPSSETTVPPLTACAGSMEQPASSELSSASRSSATVRKTFECVLMPTTAWWNGLRS